MGLCGTKAQAAEAQTGVNDTASQPKVQGNHNRGRVRRLSLATSGGAGQGAGEVRQEDSPGHGGNNVDKRKGKRGKRMSIVSGCAAVA